MGRDREMEMVYVFQHVFDFFDERQEGYTIILYTAQ